jgi:hypothetical protein
MDEAHSLRLALRRLASDPALRESLGAAARIYWEREHSPARMIADYRRVLARASRAAIPSPSLPDHLVDDGDGGLQDLLNHYGLARAPWSTRARAGVPAATTHHS